ncbi:unnamed protein product [Alopecurus aequalis]
MAGRDRAAGARMNKCKIVNMVVSVLGLLLVVAAAVSLARYIGKESFLKVCVVMHVMTICLLARFAATAPTPVSRRSYARATVMSSFYLALNLFLVLLADTA